MKCDPKAEKRVSTADVKNIVLLRVLPAWKNASEVFVKFKFGCAF